MATHPSRPRLKPLAPCSSGAGGPDAAGIPRPSLGRLKRPATAACGALVAAASLAVGIRLCRNTLLQSDAADYFRASQAGLAAAYLARGSATLPDVVRMYRERHTTSGLWDALERGADNGALRHFHVPLSYYPAALLTASGAPPRAYRLLSAAIGATIAGLVVLLLAAVGVRLWLAAGAGLLIAFNPAFVLTTTDLSPHPLFILLALAALSLQALYLHDRRPRQLYALAVVFGLSAATLELFPALLAVSIATSLAVRGTPPPRDRRWSPVVVAAGLFAATAVAAWPGGVITGGYAISYGVLAAQSLLHRDELHGPLQAALVYQRLFGGSPLLLAVIAAGTAAAALMAVRAGASSWYAPFPAYASLSLLLGLGNRLRNPEYVSEVAVFLICAAVLGFDLVLRLPSRRLRQAAAPLIALLLVALNIGALRRSWALPRSTPEAERAVGEIVGRLPEVVPAGATVLANVHGETYAAYLPQLNIERTEERSRLQPRSAANLQGGPEFLAIDERFVAAAVRARLERCTAPLMRASIAGTGAAIAVLHWQPVGSDCQWTSF